MAGITLAQAEEKLAFWLNLEEQLGITSEVTITGNVYKRQQLKDVADMVTVWDSRVKQLSASASSGGCRIMRRVVPIS